MHPLKMTFGQYLSHLDDSKLQRRVGTEYAETVRQGTAKTEKYLPPLRVDRYTLEDMKRDDMDSFR